MKYFRKLRPVWADDIIFSEGDYLVGNSDKGFYCKRKEYDEWEDKIPCENGCYRKGNCGHPCIDYDNWLTKTPLRKIINGKLDVE